MADQDSLASRSPLHVAVVTYNSAYHLADLIGSLEAAAAGMALRVVVVDNGSTDGTVELARSFSEVTVCDTGANLGYSGGINTAREMLGPGDLAILNPDLVLQMGALRTLRDTLRHDVGIAIPKLMDEAGVVDRHLRDESTILGALGDSVFGDHWPRRPRRLTNTLRLSHDYDQPRDVAWGGGAAWVVSADCDRAVGPWDDGQYFLYSEETDYARRARDLGFRVRYQPAAVAMHHGGGSGTSAELLALMSVNRIRYYAGLHRGLPAVAYRGAVAFRHLLRAPMGADHRFAFGSVLRSRTWENLPSASAPDPTDTEGSRTS